MFRNLLPVGGTAAKDLRKTLRHPKKFASYALRCLRRRLSGRKVTTILFFPEMPRPSSSMYKVCFTAGIRMKRAASRYDLACYWLDDTFRPVLAEDDVRGKKRRILNGRCIDISKERVEQAHQRAFGYGVSVDPLEHLGQLVVKSDLNAQHDGVVVSGPLEKREEGKVYQRVVQNLAPDGGVVDLRTVLVGGRILQVYLKSRPCSTRFDSTHNDWVRFATKDDVFSTDEQTRIEALARDLRLDYGDMDIMRDVENGRIYVVDVNNTPNGPAIGLPPADQDRALGNIVDALERLAQSLQAETSTRRNSSP